MAIQYEHQRVTWTDGDWADVNTVVVEPGAFVLRDVKDYLYSDRVLNIAELRYLKTLALTDTPTVLIWKGYHRKLPIQLATAEIERLDSHTDEGERILNANGFVQYMLRTLLQRGWLIYDAGTWRHLVPEGQYTWRARTDVLLEWLARGLSANVVSVKGHSMTNCDPLRDIVPVGACGFISDEVRMKRCSLAVNTAFFLLESDDWISPYSALGDPYGLFISDGEVKRPPLYNRATLWQNDSGWHTGLVSMEDTALYLSGTTFTPESSQNTTRFVVNLDSSPDSAAVYTRYYGVASMGYAAGYTPTAEGRVEFIIIDNAVVGIRYGGGALIPQNGFVLSLPDADAEWVEGVKANPRLTYTISKLGAVQQAVQGLPMLLQDGQSTLDEDAMQREQVWGSRDVEGRWVVGVVPTDWNPAKGNIADYRGARTAIGIREDSKLVIVQIDGVNSGMETDRDSAGATLHELVEMLLQAGAVNAINLDGGGSSQVYVYGGLMSRHADRRGHPGVMYERMVPSMGVVY